MKSLRREQENTDDRTGYWMLFWLTKLKARKKATHEVASWLTLEPYSRKEVVRDISYETCEATSFAHTNTIRYIGSSFCHATRDI